MAWHRHPHRGRRRRYARRARSAHFRRTERCGRDRGLDGFVAQVRNPAMRRMCLAFVVSLLAVSFAQAATTPVRFGLFGSVHTAAPTGDIKRAVVLGSDKDGW